MVSRAPEVFWYPLKKISTEQRKHVTNTESEINIEW